MAQPATTLPELVDQLGRTFSPFERLKILGRAWALLKNMTPEQRLVVATQLGLDRADEVVEAIAARGGTKASPVILSMIDQAQKKGTAHLPELISDLRDPGRRAERLRQGAAALEDAAVTAAASGEVPWLPPGTVTPPAKVESPRPAPPPPVAPPAPAPPPVQVQPLPQPRPQPPAPPAPAPPPPAPVAPPPPVQQAPPQPAAKPQPKPAPMPVQPAAQSALADRLAEVPRLTARFRTLRRSLDEAKKIPVESLGPIVNQFPDGWARRRALLELLRAGIPASLEDAQVLIETLGSERDRLWCLGALAESREIPETEREAILEEATSPLARRRLALRMGSRAATR